MPLKLALYVRWPVFSGSWVARAINVLRIHFQVEVTGEHSKQALPQKNQNVSQRGLHRVHNLAGCTANQQIHC